MTDDEFDLKFTKCFMDITKKRIDPNLDMKEFFSELFAALLALFILGFVGTLSICGALKIMGII